MKNKKSEPLFSDSSADFFLKWIFISAVITIITSILTIFNKSVLVGHLYDVSLVLLASSMILYIICKWRERIGGRS